MNRVRRPFLLTLLLVTATLVGCTGPAPPDDEGDGTPQTPGTGPPLPDLRFDGQQAYADVLHQIYTDPDNRSGPRYRIPGTPEAAEVAAWLRTELDAALTPIGGSVETQSFDGGTYYDVLDLDPIAGYTCRGEEARRERVRDITFHNVVGRTHSDALGVIIGAHYDSKRTATADDEHPDGPVLGADDGASGTAVVLNLARALAHDAPTTPFTYVLFDGEDGFEDCHPLAGSLHHAQLGFGTAEHGTVIGMVLLDMVGNASATYHQVDNSRSYRTTDGQTVRSQWLLDHIWDTAARLSVAAFVDQRTSAVIDDHVPYLEEGIPAVDIIRFHGGFPEYWHTTRDDHTAVSVEGLAQVGTVVEAAMRSIDRAERPT